MKCSIEGCPGEYEDRVIVHTVKRGSDVLVLQNVPAQVCNICSDTLLTPETVRHIEELLERKDKPRRFAALYDCA